MVHYIFGIEKSTREKKSEADHRFRTDSTLSPGGTPRFFRRENPAVSDADRFSPPDREARNITSRTCGIPRLERDSIALSRCRRCTRILQLTSNVYNSLDQQCSPFISYSRTSSGKTRLGARKLESEICTSYI